MCAFYIFTILSATQTPSSKYTCDKYSAVSTTRDTLCCKEVPLDCLHRLWGLHSVQFNAKNVADIQLITVRVISV